MSFMLSPNLRADSSVRCECRNICANADVGVLDVEELNDPYCVQQLNIKP
jgi:hypothetical protein